MEMMRVFVLLFSLLALFAVAQRFAALEVKPSGNADLDVATGIYTLLSGGSITDNRSKLSLVAKYIQYKDGDFIRAREANYQSPEGNFTATTLEYLYGADTLRMTGVQIASKELRGLKAQNGLLTKEDILVLKGQVSSSEPALEASTVVVDTTKNQALVLGNFSFRQGGSTLRGQAANATLLLNFAGGKVQANTRVPAEVLNRLRPFADRLP
jgi:hypothetical protein